MTEDVVQQIVDRMRSDGWRGDDEVRLLRVARKRLVTAQAYLERADYLEFEGVSLNRWRPGSFRAEVLESRVRAAALLGAISRAERDTALRLAPTFQSDVDELLAAVRGVLG